MKKGLVYMQLRGAVCNWAGSLYAKNDEKEDIKHCVSIFGLFLSIEEGLMTTTYCPSPSVRLHVTVYKYGDVSQRYVIYATSILTGVQNVQAIWKGIKQQNQKSTLDNIVHLRVICLTVCRICCSKTKCFIKKVFNSTDVPSGNPVECGECRNKVMVKVSILKQKSLATQNLVGIIFIIKIPVLKLD